MSAPVQLLESNGGSVTADPSLLLLLLLMLLMLLRRPGSQLRGLDEVTPAA